MWFKSLDNREAGSAGAYAERSGFFFDRAYAGLNHPQQRVVDQSETWTPGRYPASIVGTSCANRIAVEASAERLTINWLRQLRSIAACGLLKRQNELLIGPSVWFSAQIVQDL
jgi:hypothetical protein